MCKDTQGQPYLVRQDERKLDLVRNLSITSALRLRESKGTAPCGCAKQMAGHGINVCDVGFSPTLGFKLQLFLVIATFSTKRHELLVLLQIRVE